MNDDMSRIDWILRECAEIPVDPDDAELAAIALAIHLEETLGRTVPSDLLTHDLVVSPAALECTVRHLLGGC